ncbi:MAG: flagellar M-ring protein FliF [Treponema sp.]|jgi:flagellar M-ring protein FliF|nr:flagellar M-ring protein FliF [Treponema sp.]
MNEFFKKLATKATALWAGWSSQQRVIFSIVVLAVIVGVIALFRVSATPVMVPVFNAPVRDEAALDRIIHRLDQENVKSSVSPNGIVQVSDESTARRMRALLIREDLVPSGINPWEVFDRERWSLTDIERNVNLQRSLTRMITEHIRAIDEVDNANVTIVWPERQLFSSMQNPVTASVILTPKPGSQIYDNRKIVEGIQKLMRTAVEGLQPDNIVITDHKGIQLNDFEGMAEFDRLTRIERENKFILQQETIYSAKILGAIQSIYTPNRVRDLNIKFDLDMSKKTIDTKESFPVTIKERTPDLAYDDSVIVESLVLSSSTSSTTWEGTGYNPEGPSGAEGQMPPAFRDMSNLYGRMTSETEVVNREINQKLIQEERSPSIDRVTVSVNIDGVWSMKYDAKGNPVVTPDGRIEREYTPIPDENLRYVESLIRGAIGFNAARGDTVIATNIPFDRTEEFRLQDAEYFRKKQIQTTIIIFISGLILLLFGFILFRMVQRELERRRRLAEEERARREQMLRESAMAEAEQDGMDVSISLEERTRMELMEAAINMAKEHPEDAAQLIRTWLLEE